MTQPYQDEIYEDEYYEPEPRRGMSGWLIALIVVLVVILLCCACICLVVLLAGPVIGDTFSTIIESLTPIP